jgi:multidrug resistance efflux pump
VLIFIPPIDGYVTKVNVNIGKYISPTEIMFELVNPTDIHLALKIFEKRCIQTIHWTTPYCIYQ